MARIKAFAGLSQIEDWENLRRFTSLTLETIISELNGKLDFTDNIRSSGPHVVTFSNTTDSVSVEHTLGRVPNGFIVIKLNGIMVLYQPSNPEWTTTKIYLRSSLAGVASIYIV